MHQKFEKLITVLGIILNFMAILFILYGVIKWYQGEECIAYFLLGGCFKIISNRKKI